MATIAEGSIVYARLPEWGYTHRTVCHADGEFARDDDGDRFCEVHVNTLEGFWSLLRSWLRPHRGISQERLPRVRAQRPEARQGVVGIVDRTPGSTPESRMNLLSFH